MPAWLARAALLVVVLAISACGGGGSSASGSSFGAGSSSSTSSSGGSGGSGDNTLSVTVDGGPAALQNSIGAAVNTLYATVTFCTTGSSSSCQSIDHVQVDTGSTGLRVVYAALSNGTSGFTAVTDPSSGDQLLECAQFADGYTWGTMVWATVQLGSRTISNVPVHVIGDPAAGTAPSDCSSGMTAENTVETFGANGLLGIGNFLQDCPACADGPVSAAYYVCPSGHCQPVAVSTADQAQNAIGLLSADHNGVVIDLPAVTSPGTTTLTGTLYFGLGTQSDNALPNGVTMLELNDSGALIGDLTTLYNGTTMPASFIDSGSNGYYFPDSSITECSPNSTTGSFYCPSSSLALNAELEDASGHSKSVGFTIDNAEDDFNNEPSYDVYTGLGGTAISASFSGGTSFDWGLPFFYGRPVYVLFENSSLSGVTGPATGF